MLAPVPGEAWLGALWVGHPGDLKLVTRGVPRGLGGCDAQPQSTIFARAINDDPAMLSLWVAVGTNLRQVELSGHVLDRVVGASPDCRWAVVVTRAGGLPVIAAVDLVGNNGVNLLANHDLSYAPGRRPTRFTPPPIYPNELVWSDAYQFQYLSGEGLVELTLTRPEVNR